jgi:hypothetical protein
VPETWERRLKGNGQVKTILQAAHVAAYLLDPAYATVDKDWVSLPEIPAEHEQMARDLVRRVGRAAAAREFEQLLLGGYAEELRWPAAVCTDSCCHGVGRQQAHFCGSDTDWLTQGLLAALWQLQINLTWPK